MNRDEFSGPSKRLEEQVDELTERITALEHDLTEGTESTRCPFDSPELASKVIRACIESDRITEDEEEEIIAELIRSRGL